VSGNMENGKGTLLPIPEAQGRKRSTRWRLSALFCRKGGGKRCEEKKKRGREPRQNVPPAHQKKKTTTPPAILSASPSRLRRGRAEKGRRGGERVGLSIPRTQRETGEKKGGYQSETEKGVCTTQQTFLSPLADTNGGGGKQRRPARSSVGEKGG